MPVIVAENVPEFVLTDLLIDSGLLLYALRSPPGYDRNWIFTISQACSEAGIPKSNASAMFRGM